MKNTSSLLLLILGVNIVSFAWGQNNVDDIFFRRENRYKDVVVDKIRRADLIELESGEKIRLIGLKAPEAPRLKEKSDRDGHGFVVEEKATPQTPLREQAYDFVKTLLEGKHIRLEFDVEKNDPDHHTFAYVFLLKDNVFANAEILRQGYADLQIQTPNTKYAEKLRAAYREAFKERRGLQNR
jgi:micrococcal nuclease